MHTILRPRKSKLLIAFSLAAALSLTGCSGGGDGGAGGTDQQGVSTDITSDAVNLTMSYVDDPPTKALIAGFNKKYPNVTIKAQQTPFSDYVKSIKLTVASDNPPDITEYNPGAMRSLIPAGLILNLDPYSDAYGWNESFPASSLEVLTSDKDAKTYGTGSLYAVPGALSVLGVFYNKDVVNKVGITGVPTTLDEFEADMKKSQDDGTAALSVAALEVGGFQVWNALVDVLGDPADYRSWVYGKPGSTIETPGAKEATTTFQEWVSKGYIPKGSSAISSADAQADFANGKSAFLITGNWAAAALEKSMGKNVGFFALPGKTADAKKVASGASVAFSISAKTKHPNVAAAFLNYMSSPEAAQIQLDGGFMPVNTKASVSSKGLRGEISKSFGEVIDGAGITPFADFAAPGMIDKLVSGVQGMITGHTSSADYLASLQKEWNDYRE